MFLEILGYIAGFCTTVAYLPQILRIIYTRQVEEVSLYTYTLLTMGIFLWMTYGFLKGSPSMVCINLFSFVLAATILFLKARSLWR